MIYFLDENTNIRIKTDTYEELIPKYKFNAQVSGSDLKIFGQKISPNVFAFAYIKYPIRANINELVATLNYWKEYFDWHNFESEQFILEIMNTDTIKLFAENGVLAAVRPYNDYFISQSFV